MLFMFVYWLIIIQDNTNKIHNIIIHNLQLKYYNSNLFQYTCLNCNKFNCKLYIVILLCILLMLSCIMVYKMPAFRRYVVPRNLGLYHRAKLLVYHAVQPPPDVNKHM